MQIRLRTRDIEAIGISLGIAIIILVFWLWMAWWNKPQPKYIPVYPAVPTVTVAPNYYNIENVDDYLAGKCILFSQDAVPEYYATHPDIKQCKFKKVN